jgi:hypothetical protein
MPPRNIRVGDGGCESLSVSTTYDDGDYTTTYTDEMIEIDVVALLADPGIAEAIRDAIAADIKAITQTIAPATHAFRAKARKALERGAPWAVKRYGTRAPSTSDTMFNDSGALAAGLKVERTASGFAVVASHELAARHGGMDRLAELVPVIRDPFSDSRVRSAVDAAIERATRRVER